MSNFKENMLEFLKCFYSKQAPVSLETAIELFKKEPAQYFTYRQKPFEWPLHDATSRRPIDLKNTRVLVGEHTIGFVERVQCIGETARIRHIAVEKSLTVKRTGLGTTIARTYASQLRSRYGVKRIIFMEDHSNYHKSGYPAFFASLGATPLKTGPGERADRPDFEWLEKNWGI